MIVSIEIVGDLKKLEMRIQKDEIDEAIKILKAVLPDYMVEGEDIKVEINRDLK